ncbi:hypothetical protein CBL_20994 [Carabus blaptoides fortunei]
MARQYLTDKELEEIALNLSDTDEPAECLNDFESELEFSENGEEFPNATDSDEDRGPGNYYYGKNWYKWAKNPPNKNVRTLAYNLVSHLPGLKGPARDMLNIILEYTNIKITELSYHYHGNHVTFADYLDMNECEIISGISILGGNFQIWREDTASLFSTDGTGRPIFRATMSQNRFLFILSAIRFDNAASRKDRIVEGDKLAAVSQI